MSEPQTAWSRLSPGAKQIVVYGGVGAVLAVLAFIMSSGPDGRSSADRDAMVRNILTDADPRALGMDGLARRIGHLEEQLAQVNTSLDRIGLSPRVDDGDDATLVERMRRERAEELARIRADQGDILTRLDALNELTIQLAERDPVPPPAPPVEPSPVDTPPVPPATDPFPTQPERRDPPPLDAVFAPDRGEQSRDGRLQIKVQRGDAGPDRPAEAAAPGAVRIPAGTMLTGLLLSGMDAPTGTQARSQPYPALLRLKHDAILPNRFSADVRECFMILAGYGDLAAERAYMRSELISCVRVDGRTIEVAVDGYATGDDGKVGIRGRLVNKQGAMIARALQAGFLQGFAQMFSTVPVASISSGTSNTVPYQRMLSGEALQGAAVQGAGSAMDRLAEFYMDMAEQVFPIIEVDAGREVTVILNRGVELQLADARR